MEDIEGDRRYGCKTMPIVWGINASKIYVATWMTMLILALGLMAIYMLQLHWWIAITYSVILILLPSIIVFQKLFTAQTPKDFHTLSTIVKLVMFTGILSMIFFRYYS